MGFVVSEDNVGGVNGLFYCTRFGGVKVKTGGTFFRTSTLCFANGLLGYANTVVAYFVGGGAVYRGGSPPVDLWQRRTI